MELKNIRVDKIECALRYITYQPKITAKDRSNHIIGLQLSGEALHNFSHGTMNLVKDTVYFFNQKDNYTAKITDHSRCFSIHFTTFTPIEEDSFIVKAKSPESIMQLLEKIEAATLQNPPNENLALQHLYSFFDKTNKMLKRKYNSSDERIVLAKEYIDTNFMHKNCLENVVKLSKISQRRLGELFKIAYDTTLNRYITLRKINHAKKLLKLNYLSITEISDTCGFSDVYYFSKIFKSSTGFSPSQYRNSQYPQNN